jgi:hypothetical protein
MHNVVTYKNEPIKGLCGMFFICLRPRTPYPPPTLTHCIINHTGKGGRMGGELQSLYRSVILDDDILLGVYIVN